jgi:hypothetical protein
MKETIVEQLINNLKKLSEDYELKKNIKMYMLKQDNMIENAIYDERHQTLELIRFIRLNDKISKSIEDLYNEFYNQNK